MSTSTRGPGPQRKKSWIKGALAGAFMGVALATGAMAQDASGQMSYTDFVDLANTKELNQIVIQGDQAAAYRKDGSVVYTIIPPNENISERVWESGVSIVAQPPAQPNFFSSLLMTMLPFALIFGAYYWFFMRPMMGKGGKGGTPGGMGGFAQSKAKMLTQHSGRVTFDDVAGIEEAKEDLKEIVDFLRTPEKFARLGGKIPKGCLLVGPPGTGKTLTARAVAGEAGVPFFSVAGSEFVEMFVGVGASRVRDMFEQARKNAPCIIFIDEIDAMGRARNASGMGGGNDEKEQTLNQLLVEMDGFSANEGVIIMGATNRPEILDKALLRPGRFDRQVMVGLPDVKGREAILKVHSRKSPLAPDVSLRTLARGTPGFSGADLANLVNEAALFAARQDKRFISMRDFEMAKDKILMGPERKSLSLTEDDRKLTAYHEAGHAITALYLKDSDPVHKATIMPRGRALGMVMRLPEGDRVSMSLAKLKADMIVGMGGRAAEEKTFGKDKVTTGASSDIQYVTSIARQMVTEWGLSEKVGPIRYASNDQQDFLGGGSGRMQAGSKSAVVDSEVERFVTEAHAEARKILDEREVEYIRLAEALLKYETLTGDEIRALVFENKDIVAQPEPVVPPPPPPAPANQNPEPVATPQPANQNPEPAPALPAVSAGRSFGVPTAGRPRTPREPQ